jgi:hypothetical protein
VTGRRATWKRCDAAGRNQSNPARALELVDTLELAFAHGEPDPATAGPLLARIDMEVLAEAPS